MEQRSQVFAVGLLAALALSGCTAPQAPVTSAAAPTGEAESAPAPGTSPAPDFAQSIFFEPGTAALTADARRQLAGWAATMRGRPGQPVTIVGHGDELSTRDYSIALGAQRAEAVKAYLVALGVPPERLATTSVGLERPAAAGFSEEARKLDRRAVLVFESLAAVPP